MDNLLKTSKKQVQQYLQAPKSKHSFLGDNFLVTFVLRSCLFLPPTQLACVHFDTMYFCNWGYIIFLDMFT